MRKTLIGALAAVAVAMTASSALAQGNTKDFKWDGKIPIPDNDDFVFAEIIVPDDPDGLNTIADLDVDLIIQHTWQGDLIIELEHVESGQRHTILYRPGDSDGTGAGFSADDLGIPGGPGDPDKFILDDEADNYYDAGPAGWGAVPDPGIDNVTGRWRSYGAWNDGAGEERTLRNFYGKDKRGTWRLWVSDNAAGDQGTLLNFSLHFVNIPAPGALALLGLAGLVGTRQRRG